MTGKRVCYLHGGKSPGGPIIHGRYSKDLAKFPDILARYEGHKRDPQVMEIVNEIALLRALLGNYLTSFGSTLHPDALQVMRDFTDSIGRQVERRHKMLYGEQVTVTMHMFEGLVSRLLELVKTVYGDDERYARFLAECRSIVGFSASAGPGGAAGSGQ